VLYKMSSTCGEFQSGFEHRGGMVGELLITGLRETVGGGLGQRGEM
jgi:hypothetical protein